MSERYDRILSKERAEEIVSHLKGEKETRFGAYDSPENLRQLAEAAVKRVFKNKEIPPEISKLLDEKFPTNEYPKPESKKGTRDN